MDSAGLLEIVQRLAAQVVVPIALLPEAEALRVWVGIPHWREGVPRVSLRPRENSQNMQ